MINIEKEFYGKIEQKFQQSKNVAYHLVEMGVIGTCEMERYLIRSDFKTITDANLADNKRKGTRQAFKDLAEKYHKSYDAIEYIIKSSIKT